jgi:flagellar hook-associated protein 3 FlgL
VRITNNMLVDSTIRNINAAANRLNEATERVATELKISLPSDDPIIATKTIKYRDYVAKIEQYQDNAEAASSWQGTTDDALDELYDYVMAIKDDISSAATASATTSDWSKLLEEVKTNLAGIVQVMNADYGGRYIFGGYSTDEEPYALVERMATDVTVTGGSTSYDSGNLMISDNDLDTGQYTVSVSASGGTYTVTMTNGTDTYTGTTDSATGTVTLKNSTGAEVATLTAPTGGYMNGDAFQFTAAECVAITYKGEYVSTIMSNTTSDADILAMYSGNTYYDNGDDESISYDLGYGASVTVNTEGQDVVGDASSNLFNTITKLMLALSASDTTSGTTYKTYAGASVSGISVSSGTYSTSSLSISDGLALGTYSVSVAANGSNFNVTLTDTAGTTYTTTVGSTDDAAFTINGETVTLTAPTGGYAAGDAFTFTASGTVATGTVDDIDDLLEDIQNDIDRLTTAQAALGSRETYVASVADRLANDYTNYSSLLSDTIDVNTSEAAIEKTTAETVYEASLAVGAKAISKTLVDFIA